jgi:hypothetical protein
MDLASITEMFGLFRSAVGAVRDVKGLLPAHQQKPVEETLQKAELVAKTAEAKLAAGLGYQLCRCSWPPNIMIRTSAGRLMGRPGQAYRNETWKCEACGNTHMAAASAAS